MMQVQEQEVKTYFSWEMKLQVLKEWVGWRNENQRKEFQSHLFSVMQESQLFLHISFSTVLMMLFFYQKMYFGEMSFHFLSFNLFLAWIPFGLSMCLLLLWDTKRRWLFWGTGVLWLLFFPNASYLITDLMHLRYHRRLVWFDTFLLSIFGLGGIFLGLSSLQVLHNKIRSECGHLRGWIFAGTVLFLSGFGIYLGRFLRWNSWDLIHNQAKILNDLHLFVSAKHLSKMMHVTVIFFLLTLFPYALFFSNKKHKE